VLQIEAKHSQLFDVCVDRAESQNLASSHSDRVEAWDSVSEVVVKQALTTALEQLDKPKGKGANYVSGCAVKTHSALVASSVLARYAAFPNVFLFTLANEYETRPDGAYRLDRPGDVEWVKATARFVKQHDLGIANEGSRDFDDTLLAERQCAGRAVGELSKADKVQGASGTSSKFGLLPTHALGVEGSGEQPGAAAQVQTGHHVFEH